MKNNAFISFLAALVLAACLPLDTNATGKDDGPYLGWNSFDCYGNDITEQQTWDNLNVFIEKLKPYGYEYFVIDAGWYREADSSNRTDEYGRLIPSRQFFPEGFKEIIDYAHSHNVKFGLHMMRGIPREVVKKDMPIKGSRSTAADIADTNDVCAWSGLMYGVDMKKPGAQEYYNSVIALFAEWGVDFVKYDDLSHKPEEIEAIAKAIRKTGKDIVFSVSPDAGKMKVEDAIDAYRKVDMVRITRDIWDLQEDIDISFEKWEKMLPYAGNGFWLDLDMLPLGHLRLNCPITGDEVGMTRGYERMDNFTSAQKKTFITQRALAASPLFMGGALTSSPEYVFELITDVDMLECNQNCTTGTLVYRISNYGTSFDIWAARHKYNEGEGWIGVFNRNEYYNKIKVTKEQLGLDGNEPYELFDIWNKLPIQDSGSFTFGVPAHGVTFIHYRRK